MIDQEDGKAPDGKVPDDWKTCSFTLLFGCILKNQLLLVPDESGHKVLDACFPGQGQPPASAVTWVD